MRTLWAKLRWLWSARNIPASPSWPEQWEAIKRMQRMVYDAAANQPVDLAVVLKIVNDTLPAIQAGDRIASKWPHPQDK